MTPGNKSRAYTGETEAWDTDLANLHFDQQADETHVVEIANNMLDCVELCGYGVMELEQMNIRVLNNMTIGCGPMWFSYVGPMSSLIMAIKQVGITVDCWSPIDLGNNMIRAVCEMAM